MKILQVELPDQFVREVETAVQSGCLLEAGSLRVMKRLVCLLALLSLIPLTHAAPGRHAVHFDEEPKLLPNDDAKDGLADIVMPASQVGKTWRRSIKILVDSQANPPEIYPGGPDREESQRQFFRKHLQMTENEALIELKYYEITAPQQVWTLRIERFKSAEIATRKWQARQSPTSPFKAGRTTIEGQEVIFYPQDAFFPGRIKAKDGSVFLKKWRYIISASPALPDAQDFGFIMARLTEERVGQDRACESAHSDSVLAALDAIGLVPVPGT